MKICVVGGGTAGLIAALCLRKKLPLADISIVESSAIGIIGVGEGSTEHWRMFCKAVDIDMDDIVANTDATHKQGIYFENWTKVNPRYFHSIGYMEKVDGLIPVYEYLNSEGKLLTNSLAHPEFINNYVTMNKESSISGTVNQYHFDTFKLNVYMHSIAEKRGIKVFDDVVKTVNLNPEDGYVDSVVGEKETYFADFWIDATGFAQVLSKSIGDSKWVSASDFLPLNRAIPFPTGPDPSGEIRPYTRARAASSGWIWEIPTQKRRGNGYVFSEEHISVEDACREIKEIVGVELDSPRVIKFEAGHFDKMWTKNCVAIGLCGSFVEPLEATSISTAIQQALLLSTFLPTFERGNEAMQKRYNRMMDEFHQNLISMIALHYVSDRDDSKFWEDCKKLEKPEYLNNLLELWKERPPNFTDLTLNGYELFQTAHFWHVAQGQGLIDAGICKQSLSATGTYSSSIDMLASARRNVLSEKVVPHGSLFK